MVSREELISRFTVVDYVIFVAMLTVSAVIGIYYACSGKKQSTTKEFFMGGKSMGTFPVAMSILASFMSAIPMLGIPAETYLTGTQFWMVVVAYCFMFPTVAYVFMPIFYNLNISSVYEYLQLRFSRSVRTIGSTIFTLQMVMYMAIVMYAPSLALSQVTGLHVWFCVLSIGLVCTFYTTIGGIKAVVITDFFQVGVIFGAMLVVVIKGIHDEGGIYEVWARAEAGQRIELFNFNPDPTVRHTVWSLAVGGFFTWLSIYGVSQPMVQRYLTIPTIRGAKIAIWINLPGLVTIVTMTTIAGLAVYSRYHNCDPMKSKQVSAPDQLLPLFVMDALGNLTCLPGFFVAGIFSGAISTVSSGVNSLAAVTLEDIVKTYIKPDISELWATRLSKILAMCYGIASIVLVAVVEQIGGILQLSLSVFGVVGGPLLGIFCLGIFFPRANNKGALAGIFCGLVLVLWLAVGAFVYKTPIPLAPVSVEGCTDVSNFTASLLNMTTSTAPVSTSATATSASAFVLYRLSYMWYSAIGCIISIIVGFIVSLLTGPMKPADIDPKLISPIVPTLCGWLSILPGRKVNKCIKQCGARSKKVLSTRKDKTHPQNGVTNIAFITESESSRRNNLQTKKYMDSNVL